MADFKTALQALQKGDLGYEDFTRQLDMLLARSPQLTTRVLSQLDEALADRLIDDQNFARIKRKINEFRRTHAALTEGADAGGDQATVFDKASAGAQAVAADEEKTVAGQTVTGLEEDQTVKIASEPSAPKSKSLDLDFSRPDSLSQPISGATGPSSSEWQRPVEMTGEAAKLGPGSVIKERFKLLEVLGTGGMGKVYKGIDLLKEEARDRNPYIAIKLLNEDFRQHPEAFIALQREASRQQKLAHPNIATVYDFDRIGSSGSQVFITMELMEGQPLNTYIKKEVRQKGGLPFEEAFPIIRQLGAALIYAHQRNMVHSDFKPGNSFLCKDGTVKVLDFGIARAVKAPGGAGAGDKTLFDPSKLGALTPAYASLEMLEGQDPDPRDDLYALACVAYELLTGKHPFNKLPANQARDNKLLPAPVKGLKRKQMKALMRGLAFERKDRTPTVEQFLIELEGKATWYRNPYAIAAMLLAAIGIGLIFPALDYLHERKITQLIADINTGNEALITHILETEWDKFSEVDLTRIKEQARDVLQKYYENRANFLTDTAHARYDFPAAFKLLDQAHVLYPDSAVLNDIRRTLEERKSQELLQWNQRYIAALDGQKLLAQEEEDDISDVLAVIARIDPAHPLLKDPRLSNAYATAAASARDLGNLEQALVFAKAGLERAPDDSNLLNLRDAIQQTIMIAQLHDKIGAVKGQLNTLADYSQVKSEIAELATLNPTDPMLAELAPGFKQIAEQELARITGTGTRQEAEQVTQEFSDLFNALQLGHELTQFKLAHLKGEARDKAIAEIIATDQAKVQELLAKPALDQTWESQMLASLQSLASLLPADDATLHDIRVKVAELYVAKAKTRTEKERFAEAKSLLDRGERLAPGAAPLIAQREAVALAEQAFELKRQEALRIARVNGLKETFSIQTQAKDVEGAKQTFAQLQAELPAGDTFLAQDAPKALADAYQKLADSKAKAKDFASAMRLAKAGLELVPEHDGLKKDIQGYVVEANKGELEQVFSTAVTFDLDTVKGKLTEIETLAPDRYVQLRSQYVSTLADRINKLQDTDPQSAARLAGNALALFPNEPALIRLRDELAQIPWEQAAVAQAALATGRLTEGNALLAAAMATNPAHPEVQSFRAALEARIKEANTAFDQYRAAFEAKQYPEAENFLKQARTIWSDNPDYIAAEQELRQVVAAPKKEPKILTREEDIALAEPPTTAAKKAEEAPWKPIPSDRACTEKLAGYGSRARAICYDLIHERIRGPLMVVVPGDGTRRSFAIGKYEVSVNDYNKYCYLSGNCKVIQAENKDAPITGLTYQEAEAYVKWLSERTGKKYRMPTAEEWEYAAQAGGKQQVKDYNCRVTLGDQVLKGTGPVDVNTGQQNAWGLKNYIGNVQEWVTNGSALEARGGAYSDTHSKCSVTLTRPHNGQADETTGFRVLLEEVG